MPLKSCQVNGKTGTKYGNSGTCFTGKSGRDKAIKQMIAVKISQGEIKPKRKK